MSKVPSLVVERTNLRTLLSSILLLSVGILLIWISGDKKALVGHGDIRALLQNLGALFVASIAIAMLWELSLKRAFRDELFAQARIAEELRSSGIVGFTPDFRNNIGSITESVGSGQNIAHDEQ